MATTAWKAKIEKAAEVRGAVPQPLPVVRAPRPFFRDFGLCREFVSQPRPAGE